MTRIRWRCGATISAVCLVLTVNPAVGGDPVRPKAAAVSGFVEIELPVPQRESVVRHYEVGDLIGSLARRHAISRETALDTAIDRLWEEGVTIRVEEEGTLSVKAPPRYHETLAATFEIWREAGFDQVVAEIEIYGVPCPLVERVVGELKKVEAADPATDLSSPKSKSSEFDRLFGPSDWRRVAPSWKSLTSQEAIRFRTRLRQTDGCECLLRRRIVACNGRPVEFNAFEDRPFLVRYVPDGQDYRKVYARVPEGLAVALCPHLERDGTIKLPLRLRMSDITNVHYFSLGKYASSGRDGHESLKTLDPVEQPMLECRSLEMMANVAAGEVLVIGGLVKRQGNEHVSASLLTLRLQRLPVPVDRPRDVR